LEASNKLESTQELHEAAINAARREEKQQVETQLNVLREQLATEQLARTQEITEAKAEITKLEQQLDANVKQNKELEKFAMNQSENLKVAVAEIAQQKVNYDALSARLAEANQTVDKITAENGSIC
jgi:DNA repair exonuclease SbcCD ATPase subunit